MNVWHLQARVKQKYTKFETTNQSVAQILRATFFSTLELCFLHPALFFPPSTFLFHPLNLLFSPSNLLFSPSTLSFLTLDPFFFTLLPLLSVLVGWLACCNASQISTAFGENTGLRGFG